MPYVPNKEDVARMKAMGWSRMVVNVPPGLHELLRLQGALHGKTLSRFTWLLLVGIMAKVVDLPGADLKEIKKALVTDEEVQRKASARVHGLLRLAQPEEDRVYKLGKKYREAEEQGKAIDVRMEDWNG